MSIQAPPRGVLVGRTYLDEVKAMDLIRALRMAGCFLDLFMVGGSAERNRPVVRAENAVLRVVRELEDALGSSADE